MKQQQYIFTAGRNEKWYNHFGRVGKFLTKLNIVLPYSPATMLLDIYLIGMKSMSTQKSVHKYL